MAVLFARKTSIYKSLSGTNVFDVNRDARTWQGGEPVVAHPPCRAWGRLRHFAKPREDEKSLAIWAVEQVQRWGGALEHPECSTLWKERKLPRPGHFDNHGGFTLPVLQQWWGHRAEKATWLYIVGTEPVNLPPIPLVLGYPTHVVARGRGTKTAQLELSAAGREATPPDFARWLLAVARSTRPKEGRTATS